jgi:hypothetical protein
MKKSKPKEKSKMAQSKRKVNRARTWWILVALAMLLIVVLLFKKEYSSRTDSADLKTPSVAESPDFRPLIGDWVRPDGGYILRIRNVKPDGEATVGYYNPGKINVAAATASVEKKMLKVFITLQDKGYPGSTYTLFHIAEKDVLLGIYFQAVLKRAFEVVFVRKK